MIQEIFTPTEADTAPVGTGWSITTEPWTVLSGRDRLATSRAYISTISSK